MAGRPESVADRAAQSTSDTTVLSTTGQSWHETQQVFSQVQLLIWDRSFYDPDTGEYTVDKFLTETESRVGPYRCRSDLARLSQPRSGRSQPVQPVAREQKNVPALRKWSTISPPWCESIFPDIAWTGNARERRGSLGSDFAATQRHWRRPRHVENEFQRLSARLPTPPAIPRR